MCYYCGDSPTVFFNDDKLACTACKEERINDDTRFETEADLWWPLAQPALAA